MINLQLPYPPSSNRLWRTGNGATYISQEAREYKQNVALLARVAKAKPFDGNVFVNVRVYRPRQSGDLDNRLKVVLDALQGVCYHDDKQVVKIIAERFDDPKHPRVEVEINLAA